jgi:hypothetical protein
MMAACRYITQPDDLIAVSGGGFLICGSMFLERPVVSSPQGRMDNPEDVQRFLEIYKPKLVVPVQHSCVRQVAYEMGYQPRLVPSHKRGWQEQVLIRPDGL